MTDAVSVPPVFVAVIVYDADAVTVVGVPEIAPVVLERVNPAGRDGETDHETTHEECMTAPITRDNAPCTSPGISL